MRTSFVRGLFALFGAPLLMTLPFAAMLYLQDVWTGGGGLPTGARPLLHLAPAVVRVTLMLGTPLWLLLRLLRRETVWVYTIAGFSEGLLVSIAVAYGFSRDFPFDVAPYAAIASLMGASIAATFWFLAREPDSRRP